MGYGSRALKALNAYYSGEIVSVDEETRLEPEYPFPGKVGKVCRTLHREAFFSDGSVIVNGSTYGRAFGSRAIGDATATDQIVRKKTGDLGLSWCFVRSYTTTLEASSFSQSPPLLTGNLSCRFWKRAGYVPLYMRQTTSELTGEHSCIMVRGLNSSTESELEWLAEFAKGARNTLAAHIGHTYSVHSDFRRRFLTLLSYNFREFGSVTALSIIEAANSGAKSAERERSERGWSFSLVGL